MYHFQVTVNVILICDLVFRIMLSEHISYIICGNPTCGVRMHVWMTECHVTFKGHFQLDI